MTVCYAVKTCAMHRPEGRCISSDKRVFCDYVKSIHLFVYVFFRLCETGRLPIVTQSQFLYMWRLSISHNRNIFTSSLPLTSHYRKNALYQDVGPAAREACVVAHDVTCGVAGHRMP